MYLKHLYKTVNKVMCYWINCTRRVLPHWYLSWFHRRRQKKILSCIIGRIRSYIYKMLGINFAVFTSFTHLKRKIKNCNISLKFIMLTYDNQIFRNWFIIYWHLTKISVEINKCLILEPNELSITTTIMIY